MWHGDLCEFPLLAAYFRFDAIRSLLGRATSAAKAEPITKTGPARWIAGGPAGHESGGAGWGRHVLMFWRADLVDHE